MKTKVLMLLLSFVSVSPVYLAGQYSCTNSTKLICQVPITAINLVTSDPAFADPQIQEVANAINASIGTQLTQLPIPSATAGTVLIQVKGSQFGLPYENLGPILTDRPDLVGQGRLFGGFSYQHFNFNHIDGIDLGSLPVGYTFQQTIQTAGGSDLQTYFANNQNKIGFQLDQYVLLLDYGASKTTDFSLIVPFNSVNVAVTSSAYNTYVYDSLTKQFSPIKNPENPVKTAGSASGVGDVTFNVKQLLYGAKGEKMAFAIGGAIRLPTGDALNYLGSGTAGFNLYALFAYRGPTSPHLKIGNQWNSTSVLVNPTAATNNKLPGGVQFDAGVDQKIRRGLDVSFDIVGNQFVNTPSLAPGALSLREPQATAPAPVASLADVTPLNNTYNVVNLSTGIKWSPKPHLLLYGNVLIQLNDVGFRSDPVPLAGISYSFKKGDQ